MWFATPILLLLLVPWGALVVVFLRRHEQPTDVPFLFLWSRSTTPHATRGVRRFPPIPIAALLFAVLLAIVAAAAPMIPSRAPSVSLSIIVDRGVTMLPETRFKNAVQSANRALLDRFAPSSNVNLVPVPAGSAIQTRLSDWTAQALALKPIAISSQDVLAQAIQRAKESGSTVIAITDRNISDPSVVQITPAPIRDNIGITHVAAREMPSPQIMVTIRNDSSRRSAKLQIPGRVEAIDLPPTGAEKNYFFSASTLPPAMDVSLADSDDYSLDNHAYLARESSFPTFDLHPGLPLEVNRVVAAYEKTHPAGDNASHVAITTDPTTNGPAIIVATNLRPLAGSPHLQVIANPITASLAVSRLKPLLIASAPNTSWNPLILADDKPILAFRDKPAPQVWVGFSAPDFGATTDFVVLWTNILSHFAGPDSRFQSHPISELSPDYKLVLTNSPAVELAPGIYQRSDKLLLAQNIEPVRFPNPRSSDFAQALAARVGQIGAIDLADPLLMAALASILLAVVTLRSLRLPRVAPGP